ncbi:MAG: phosphatidylglycerophosphatase A [Phycisphaerae bacterium]
MSISGPDRLKAACITVLGSGYLRPASGTWGSATAVVLFAPVWLAAGAMQQRCVAETGLVLGIAVSSIIAVMWGSWAVAHFKSKDPKSFVLDEFAGQWVALLAMPAALSAGWLTLMFVVGGQFVLFRIMDILKPPPARQLERLRDGWGILLDDLFAGLYANIVGQVVWRLTPLAAMLGLG